MNDRVLGQLGAIRTMEIAGLKAMWRDLMGTEPPPYNRRYIESRLAYRVQELAHGGLKPETVKRLRELAAMLEPPAGGRRRPQPTRPVAGTRLVREWQGFEHTATVTRDGFEYEGRPYRSLSAIARAITGRRWNGWVFFGLKAQGRGG